METIDDREANFPEEAVVEINEMLIWMKFTGIVSIIFSFIMMIWTLKNPSGMALLGFLSLCVSFYLGFLLLFKAYSFKVFTISRNLEILKKTLRMNQNYWKIATISIIVNLLITLIDLL